MTDNIEIRDLDPEPEPQREPDHQPEGERPTTLGAGASDEARAEDHAATIPGSLRRIREELTDTLRAMRPMTGTSTAMRGDNFTINPDSNIFQPADGSVRIPDIPRLDPDFRYEPPRLAPEMALDNKGKLVRTFDGRNYIAQCPYREQDCGVHCALFSYSPSNGWVTLCNNSQFQISNSPPVAF